MSESNRSPEHGADEQSQQRKADEQVQDLPEQGLGLDDAEQVKGGVSLNYSKIQVDYL